MNLKEIREIINLMNDNDLSEIELERDGTKVKIKKSSADAIAPVYRSPVEYKVETQAQIQSTEISANDNSASNRLEIPSPMVGTFYRSPSPDSPPFIEIGQVVEVGQVVCVVEAMKLMNEIKSEIRGKIVEAPVENAQPVEFGQALYYVEPV